MGISYHQIKLGAAKSSFRDLMNNAQETFKEDGINILGEGFSDVIADESTFSRYRDVMLEGCDANDAEQISQIIDNSRWETLNESVTGITPISSLSVPAIRALWPRLALKNAIPTEVVKAPKFSLSYIIPYLRVFEDGVEKEYQLPKALVNGDKVSQDTWGMGLHLYKGWIDIATGTPAYTSTKVAGGFNLRNVEFDSTGKVVTAGTSIDHVDPDFSICGALTKTLYKYVKGTGDAAKVVGLGFATTVPEGVDADSAVSCNAGVPLKIYCRCELRGGMSYEFDQKLSGAAIYNLDPATFANLKDVEDVYLTVQDTLFGKVDFDKCNLKMASSNGEIVSVKVNGRFTFENNERTETVMFKIETKDITIGTGIHIDAPLPNEFLSDVSVMYSIDGVAKIIDILTQTVALRLDNEIREYIIKGYDRQTNRSGMEMFHGLFNCRPDDRYNGTPKDWREQIKLTIDFMANMLKQRNYFQGGKFIIVANPVDAAIIPNTSWSFVGSTTERSGIEVDYDIGAISGSQRYEVISSQLIPAGEMYILYVSSQDEQMTYKYYPYSFLVTRDMRNEQRHLLPNVTMCKRHKLEYFHDAMIKITVANNNGVTTWEQKWDDGRSAAGVNKQIFNAPPKLV